MAPQCELPFDKLPSIRCLWHLLGANGWFIAPFVVSLPVLSEVEGSNHASAFHLLVQSPVRGFVPARVAYPAGVGPQNGARAPAPQAY